MEDLLQKNAALVVFAFLQADCRNSDYSEELLTVGKEFHLAQDINCNGPRIQSLADGDLECDGHQPSRIALPLDDIQPLVEPQWPRNHVEAAALREVAESLKEIADQLEHNVVARAVQNLRSNISASPTEQWQHHLAWEVERAMREGVGLEHLQQERVLLALTLTVVKGVCEQAPRMLRSLFNAALQCIRPERSR